MIFGQKYDNSLWLIMKSNKNVEDDVAKFFDRFPQELLMQIRESIKKFQNSNVEEMFFGHDFWLDSNLRGCYQSEAGILYRYNIDLLGTLEISESFIINDKEMLNLGCITLYPFDLKDINNMSNLNTFNLGMIGAVFTLEDDILYVPSNLLTEISFIKFPFVNIVNCWGFLTNFKQSFHKANIKNIPANFTLQDIQQIRDSKKLVRKKNK